MEFKFRAVDERPPICPNPPSSISYFTEHALRGPGPMRNPGDVREAIEWELEKDRIREELIVADIARRRVLEAEVRTALMIEREMAMRRLAATATPEGLSLEERLAMRFDPRLPQLIHPFESFAFPGCGGAIDTFPMMPRLLEAMPLDIKPPREINKDKLIVLAKPDPNLSGTKRKAVTPPAGSTSELPPFGLKKRPKEEWSCALCQVSATSERGFNEHLQGKKHKAKEARLRAQTMGKIASSTPLPKETTKPSKLTDTTDIGSSGLQARVEGESLHQNKTGDGSHQKLEITEDSKNANEQVLLQKNQNAEDSKTNGTATDQGAEKITEFKKTKKFKFWCEMCQIGAYSQVVMEGHKKGKKHRSRLQELGQKDGFDVTTSFMAAPANTPKELDTDLAAKEANNSDATQKPEDTDVMAKEANEKTAETVIADEEKSVIAMDST
ncbi:uncharacterized protein LOC132184738 isoform X2 [Corylus avellana]|uniref:uncharacterized protein LOC132184738 isoform X2 n=1 Tax=Corylus avellana TaxID=13451 RepID=UPI00286AD308|nr:uncharacterized protein LOC132184738 isoform X2 [Corylus avellana]